MKRSIFFTIGSLAIIIAVILPLGGCLIPVLDSDMGQPSKEEDVYYTVSFVSKGGNSVSPQQVKKGEYATRPEDPTRENYSFTGWKCNGKDWSFTGSKVTSDVQLEAQWQSIYYVSKVDNSILGLTDAGKKQSILHVPEEIDGLIIKKIMDRAFSGCKNLTKVYLGETTVSIGSNAFSGCSSLTTIKIPSSVTTIWNSAFSGCSNLTEIQYPGTVAQWNAIKKMVGWNNNTGKYTIYCADGIIQK